MSQAVARQLLGLRKQVKSLKKARAADYLAHDYANFLYGGWRHESGRWVDSPHLGAQRFHEACKARFCSFCNRCAKQKDNCKCGPDQDLCWGFIGSAPVREEAGGEGEAAVRTCPKHGPIPWRKTNYYTTCAMFPGNKWAKTHVMVAELCAGIIGYRPWDDTLSNVPQGSGRIHLLICQTFTTSALLTIEPIVKKYLSAYIIKALITSSHMLSGWLVRGSDGVGQDIFKIASQDQHYRNTSAVSPIEGVNPVQLGWDEPMEGDIRATATRGLLPALGVGAGNEYIAATLLEGSAKAAAYMRGEIWDHSWVNGGGQREVFAMTGLSSDNPAYTHSEIQTYLNRFPPWEREARFNGTTMYRRGLIIPDFQHDVHVYDEALQDPLVDLQTGEPTPHPVFMAADPHDVRPWMLKWIMLLPGGYEIAKGHMIFPVRVIREWPEGAFREMRHFSHAEPGFGGHYKDYARIIDRVERTIPGGPDRVLKRYMDPAFGDSLKMGGGKLTTSQQMRAVGYTFHTDIPREVEPGHNLLRFLVRGSWSPGDEVDAMHRPHLLVAGRCQNTIWAFLNYVNDDGSRQDKMRERPGEAGKDDIDCLRYILVSRPWYQDWRTVGQGNLRRMHATAARAASSRPF